MSKPIRCVTCYDLVGTYTTPLFIIRNYKDICPGSGKHKKPIRTEKRLWQFLWLKKKITIFYPETHTYSVWIQ